MPLFTAVHPNVMVFKVSQLSSSLRQVENPQISKVAEVPLTLSSLHYPKYRRMSLLLKLFNSLRTRSLQTIAMRNPCAWQQCCLISWTLEHQDETITWTYSKRLQKNTRASFGDGFGQRQGSIPSQKKLQEWVVLDIQHQPQ